MIVTTYDTLMVPKLQHPWNTITIALPRGGEMGYTYYDQLPDLFKKLWDALEDFLIRLSRNRNLYVVGCFEKAPETVEKFIFKRRKRDWLGACEITQNAELHKVLRDNPIEWFDYIVTDTIVSSEVAGQFVNVPVKKHFFEHIIDSCTDARFIIEENNDRDCFFMAYRKEDLSLILDEISTVLLEHGFEFAPKKEHLPSG